MVKTDPLRGRRTTKTIAVHTDGPDDGFLRLSVSFTAVPAISVLPDPFLSVRANEGERAKARVLLRRTDGAELVITGSHVELPVEVETRTERVTEAGVLADGSRVEPGDLWFELSVPPSAPAGRRRGVVTLDTNHEQLKTLDLPINLWIRSVVDVRPNRVRLWVYDDDPRTEAVNLRLNQADQLPFSIAGVEVSHPDVFRAVPQTSDPGPMQVVRVTVVDDVDRDRIRNLVRGWLRISISGATARTVEVPVTVGVRSTVPVRPVAPVPTGTPTGSLSR